MVERPFRFGVIAPKCGSGKELTEWARRAEALGYSSLFVPDHFIDHDLAPTVALAHVAAVTDTLRVGPLVLGNDYKHTQWCSPARWRRSTSCPAAGSSSASARAG
jgi:alkanesulfonate monooxygenase SsuD/methylene tetrahydromethanopterin reductase-like flavin-dependent oxidoreductase (luciferase family)